MTPLTSCLLSGGLPISDPVSLPAHNTPFNIPHSIRSKPSDLQLSSYETNMADAQQTPGAETLNPMGGNLPTEDAVDIKPGKSDIPDISGDKEHLQKVGGDMGVVKGPGLGSVQGGIDARGGTAAPSVAEQTDTSKLEGSKA